MIDPKQRTALEKAKQTIADVREAMLAECTKTGKGGLLSAGESFAFGYDSAALEIAIRAIEEALG